MEQIILSEHCLLLLQARFALKIKMRGLLNPKIQTDTLAATI
jgi:hypothetical protein